MIVRTCLLISDDPDDHVEFSEALYDISDDTVLVTVSDIGKAIDLVAVKKCVPEFILLNVAIPEFRPDKFFDALNDDPALKNVQVITYGDGDPIHSPRITAFLDQDVSYSELKETLRRVIGGKEKR
jgi:hypothetical protein